MMELNLINSDRKAMVDDEDYNKVKGLDWSFVPISGYVTAQNPEPGRPKRLSLHRVIMRIEKNPSYEAVHKDMNKLNNTKANLYIRKRGGHYRTIK